MPRSDYKRCKDCDKPSSEVGALSHERLCLECGRLRLEGNYDGLTRKTGPWFLHYRRSMVAAYGGVLLDDLAANVNTPHDAA